MKRSQIFLHMDYWQTKLNIDYIMASKIDTWKYTIVIHQYAKYGIFGYMVFWLHIKVKKSPNGCCHWIPTLNDIDVLKNEKLIKCLYVYLYKSTHVVLLTHSQFLEGFKCESQTKNNERVRSRGTFHGSQHFGGVKGCARALGWD